MKDGKNTRFNKKEIKRYTNELMALLNTSPMRSGEDHKIKPAVKLNKSDIVSVATATY